MTTSGPAQCDEIQIEVVPLARKRRLPSLKPITNHPARVESLTGYITRLALWIAFSPLDVLTRIVFPSMPGKRAGSASALKKAALLHGESSSTLVATLAQETGVANLGQTTGLTLATIFSFIHLIRTSRCWCPLCLAADDVAYDRLLWTLEAVTHCQDHEIALESKCPKCAASQPHLSDNGAADRCCKCGGKLHSVQHRAPEPESYGVWGANQVAQLLVSLQNGSVVASAALVARRLGEETTPGSNWSTKALSRAVGVGPNTVWYWINKGIHVRLSHALRICWLLGIDLVALVSAGESEPRTPRGPVWTARTKRSLPVGRATYEDVVRVVARLRIVAPLTRPSRRAVAKELGMSEWSHFFRHEKIMALLDDAQRTASRIRNAFHVWETCNVMRAIVRNRLQGGHSITQRSVREQLHHYGLAEGVLLDPFARKFFSRLRAAAREGNMAMLKDRPPPRIIRPLLEISA